MRLLASILIVTPLMGTIPDSSEFRCPEAIHAAYNVGWALEDLLVLDDIVWDESRCLSDVVGTGAYGLTQIQYNAHSNWIDSMGYTREDLFDPEINMRVALALASYARIAYGCWAQPWYMSGDRCS